MPRWSKQETELLDIVRTRLHAKLAASPQFPEVVGDRKLLRFLRGHNYDVDKACEMIQKWLDWRAANEIDAIRMEIVNKNLDCPSKFPFGELILRLVPQVVVSTVALDLHQNPISVENLVPASIWSEISVDDFIKFRIYCLEYVAMVLEQFSVEMEKSTKESHPEEYGVVAQLTILRCMKTVSLSAFTKENKEIAAKIINLASDNYPELMAKCYMVNCPWFFTPIYSFVKLFLAAKTVSKIFVLGHDFLHKITKDVPLSSIPDFLGGQLVDCNPTYHFDLSEGGPLWSEEIRHLLTTSKEINDATNSTSISSLEQKLAATSIQAVESTSSSIEISSNNIDHIPKIEASHTETLAAEAIVANNI